MPHSPEYKMALDLGTLRHLGIGLYSNVPDALSEAVANAWDADASRVSISTSGDRIVIEDDGCGMTVADANKKYLRVGYERRKEEGGKTPKGRPVMGRKGIGKLSLFSVADNVMIHSVRGDERHGFAMRVGDIEDSIKRNEPYFSEPIGAAPDLEAGTRVTLSGLKSAVYGVPLKMRLARRFGIIGEIDGFEVAVNGDGIGVEDRGYYENLQYVWNFGGGGKYDAGASRGGPQKFSEEIRVKLDGGDVPLDGWIGTVHRPGQLRDADTGDNMNRVAVMVRGKVVQEDMLGDLARGGVHSGYIVGEICADFLDADDEEDIVTTGRQRIKEDAPRYEALAEAVQRALGVIEQKWNGLRGEEGLRRARVVPEIDKWYEALGLDHKRMAKSLFGGINRMPIDDDGDRRRLLIGGILAFESLRLRDVLDRLSRVGAGGTEGLDTLRDMFLQLDDLDASAYYQTAKSRLGVIGKLVDIADGDGLERVVQRHLFDHLWLLDPSWERAAGTEYMETEVNRALDAAAAGEGDQRGRLDIKYRTAAGKHIVIELKRPGVRVETGGLVTQISKYERAVRRALDKAGRGDEPVEFVCVVGEDPVDWGDPGGRDMSEKVACGIFGPGSQVRRDHQGRPRGIPRVHRERGARVSRVRPHHKHWRGRSAADAAFQVKRQTSPSRRGVGAVGAVRNSPFPASTDAKNAQLRVVRHDGAAPLPHCPRTARRSNMPCSIHKLALWVAEM